MVGLSPEFLYVNLGVERFSSDLSETGWYSLVCVCVCVCVCACGVLVHDKANGVWFLFC